MVMVRWWHCHAKHGRMCFTWHLFNNNKFSTSAALAEFSYVLDMN